VGLSPVDRAELLAILSSDPDPNISERAKSSMLTQPLDSLIAAILRPAADPRVFRYAVHFVADKPGIADALAMNPSCPVPAIAAVAKRLTPKGIQSLLDDLERVTKDPGLAAALRQVTSGTPEQNELLKGLDGGTIDAKEIEEAAAVVEPDPIKRETLMQKLVHMNVVERLTLALKGGREERMLLIRDTNKLVQKCVLQSPRLTDTEVEAYASMANVSQEVLRTISLNRHFMKNYAVAKNLVRNPKTPVDISLHLLQRLTPADLAKLTTNKNIPETVQKAAINLERKRKIGKAD
jgi:hypothetical protein